METKRLELSQDLETLLINAPIDLEVACEKAREMTDQIITYLSEAMINNQLHVLKSWSYEAKSFVVLLRDACFQIYKSEVISLPEDATINHWHKIANLIAEAKTDLAGKYEVALAESHVPEEWKHFHDPTPTIITQIEELADQIQSFLTIAKPLEDFGENMDHAKDNIHNLLDLYANDVNILEGGFLHLYKNYIQDGKFLLENNLTKFKKSLEKTYKSFQDLSIEKAKPKIEDLTQTKQKIPIKVVNGALIYKEIDILKEVQNWHDKVFYPAILECEKYLEILHEKTSRIILNSKNRIELFESQSDENIASAGETIKRAWENLQYEIENLTKDFFGLKDYLENKTDQLSITDIFKEDRFFLEKKDDLGDDDDNGDEKWVDLLPVKKTLHAYQAMKQKLFKSGIIKDQGLTDIIQFVKNKSVIEIDKVTYSLFLNRGYLGNSFVVKRKEIVETIAVDIENWYEGFRGSVLLYGQRLSGKTTIIESLPYYMPKLSMIQLKTESTIEFKSRKMTIGCDLEEALDFILKNSVSDKIVVSIDDLELWRNAEGLLFKNVQILQEYQNKYSKRIFFIVITNHWFKNQLDNYFNFSAKFTSSINTDEMKVSNIKKAIQLRHAASLKDAIYHDHIPGSDNGLNVEGLAKKVSLASNQNVGASLKEWAHVYHAGNINPKRFQKNLPESMIRVIQNRWTIIHFILKFKITSEKELVKTLGSTFLKEITPDIQFLISCKILQRDSKNLLMINEYIIDEIEAYFLKNKEYLKRS